MILARGATTATSPDHRTVPWSARETVVGTLLGLAVLFGWQLAFAGLDVLGILEIEGALGVILPWGHLLMAMTIWWLVRRGHGAGLEALGLRPVSLPRGFSLYAQALLLSYASLLIWGIIVYALTGRGAQENLLPAFGTGREALLAAALSASLIAPVTEELLFRGFLFAGLRGRLGLVPAVVVSSLAFALFHFNPYAFPALVALGAVLAWLFQRSGSLWPGVALHATINTVTLLVWYAQTSGLIPTPPA